MLSHFVKLSTVILKESSMVYVWIQQTVPLNDMVTDDMHARHCKHMARETVAHLRPNWVERIKELA